MDERETPGLSPSDGETKRESERDSEREAGKSRRALDAVPEPGTDPLHEGP